MKQYLFLAITFLLTFAAEAQVKKKKNAQFNKMNKPENTFLNKQWWIGLKGGLNFSSVYVDQSFSVITPTNYDATLSGKKYEEWDPISAQAGIDITFYLKGFSISVQPTFQTIRFGYSNNYEWTNSENPEQRLELEYTQQQKADYVIIPLLFRYEHSFNKFSPYLQAGVYGGYPLDGTKEARYSGTDYASGGVNVISSEPVEVGAKDLFAPAHYGIVGGGGLYFTTGNIRLNLDIQYKYGLTLINSTENRYSNDRLSGFGDAMDNIMFRNIAVSVGTLFPLRFLSSGFKSSQQN